MLKIKQKWQKLPRWIKNKYTVSAVVFLVYLLFFDSHDLISQLQLKAELNEVEKTKAYYKEEIKITQIDLEELLTNNEQLERFAREKYLMKKDDEDIFVFVEE